MGKRGPPSPEIDSATSPLFSVASARPKRPQERREVDMVAEVVHAYVSTRESEALLEGKQLSLRVGESVRVTEGDRP